MSNALDDLGGGDQMVEGDFVLYLVVKRGTVTKCLGWVPCTRVVSL